MFVADAVIQSARRRYGDGRNRLTAVSNELQQVQNVMVQNIEDVIHRGEALNSTFSSVFLMLKVLREN